MLSSLKKSRDQQSAVVVPAWHPNFRNVGRLPDTKAVRTSFFINGLGIFVAVVLAVYAGYQEYALYALSTSTSIEIKAVGDKKPSSDKAVELYKKFQEEEKRVLALQQFLSGSEIIVSDFILQLGGDLPATIKLYTIDYKPTAVTLRGSIDGASDEASGRAVAYVEHLRTNAVFSKLFESVSLTNIVRDPGTGLIQFVIDLKVKVTAKSVLKGDK